MIDYQAAETQLCALLCPVDAEGKQLNKVYTAEPLPDNEAEYRKAFDKPKVYISCVGSDYGEDESTHKVIQEETVTFEAIIRARTRRGTSGILAILTDIRQKILGYRFAGCKKIVMIKSGYIDGGTQNDWNYMISFSLRTHVVEMLPEPTGVAATEIEFQQ